MLGRHTSCRNVRGAVFVEDGVAGVFCGISDDHKAYLNRESKESRRCYFEEFSWRK